MAGDVFPPWGGGWMMCRVLLIVLLGACTPLPSEERDAAAPDAVCDRNTCTGGCCLPDGTCIRDTSVEQCGADGRACLACEAGEICSAGVCALLYADTPTCRAECRGCCIGRRCAGTFSDGYCGVPGGTCSLCAFHEACEAGACVLDDSRCGPHNCAGCCEDGYRCIDDLDGTRCGLGGLFCEDCVESGYRTCEAGRCVR